MEKIGTMITDWLDEYGNPEIEKKVENNLLMEEILRLVDEYIRKNSSNQKWREGIDLVKYGGNYFDSEEYTAGIKTFLTGYLGLNTEGNKFERNFPKLMGKKYGLLTNSGSSANLLMMAYLTSKKGYNLPKGTKVITPIAGFPTTINPIFQMGFTPIFVDIELDTLNLNLDDVEFVCEQNPDAKIITFAHVLGNPPDMDRLMQIVKKYNLILLEDCCDALGSFYDGKPLGSFGELASCSFFPAHHITMGEGGFVSCNTIDAERIIRSFREWGRGCYCVGKANQLECGSCGVRFNNWLPSLPDEVFDHKYVYDEIGYNLKPIEMQAAIGNVQMKKLDEIGVARRKNYNRLFSIFEKYEDKLILHRAQPKSDPNWFAFPITVRDNVGFKRSDITQFLESKKIQTRPYFAGNIMLQPAYEGMMDKNEVISKYPVARKVTTDTFFLGTSPVIIDEQLDYIEKMVDDFFTKLN
jgi:CDP-6-deoxy-D-xylo-4-hexulose-3-dehydrase